MKRWYLAVALVVALLAAGAGWLVLRPEQKRPAAASCVKPVAPPADQAPVAEPEPPAKTFIGAPDGGGLKVIETGFTQMADNNELSVGAVIENTSAHIAYHTWVTFQARTGKGTAALSSAERHILEIPFIHPGQRAVVGNYISVDREPSRQGDARLIVAQAGLDLIQTQWLTEAVGPMPKIETTLNPKDPPAHGVSGIGLVSSTDVCLDLQPRGVTAIFRDAAGKVIGGTFDTWTDPERCRAGKENILRAIVLDGPPPRANLPATEGAVLCDIPGYAPNPLRSGQPIN